MAEISLYRQIPLAESDEIEALEIAKKQLKVVYSELLKFTPLLEKEVHSLNTNWTLEVREFDSEIVSCDDWDNGNWNVSYLFDIAIKSPDGNPECDFLIDAWDEWETLNQPMYRDVFEPLQKCKWQGFKRDDVSVKFDAINVVDSYSGKGLYVYNNQGYL
jgi:hypothetical protein